MLMSFLKHNHLKIHVVCGATPWPLVSSYGHFGGSYCLHPQSSSWRGDPEYEVVTLLRNVGDYLPVDSA